MESIQFKSQSEERLYFVGGSLAYWSSVILLGAVLFWFGRAMPLMAKFPLGALFLVMPPGWFNVWNQFKQVQETYRNVTSHSKEIDELYAVASRALGRQIGLAGAVLFLALFALKGLRFQ